MPRMRQEPQEKRLIKCLNKMDKRPVLFLDSGIGSLPYAVFFHSRNPKERLICAADRLNFPYGTKSKEALIKLVLSFTKKLINQYNPKILAVACNTATVSTLQALREEYSELPIVGTVPAIKPAVLASRKRCIGVLGTQRTIEDPYIAELAGKFGPDCKIIGEAAPKLVDFIEYRWIKADKEERLEAVKPWVSGILNKGADALVLACTHFLFLKDEFVKAGGDKLLVFDSVEGISRRVESLIHSTNSSPDDENSGSREQKEQIYLVVSGNNILDENWKNLAAHFDISLEKI